MLKTSSPRSSSSRALRTTNKSRTKQHKSRSTLRVASRKRSFATIVSSPEGSNNGIVHPIQTYPANEHDTPLDRVKGNFPTFFRHAVLTKALTDLTAHGGPITFFNITGANIAHQLKESHLHKDAVYLYKWLRLPLGLRRIPAGIDSLKPWLKQFAHANEDVPLDGFGFPKDLYLPGTDFIASRVLRPQDKHIIFETRQEMIDLAQLAFKDDPRVEINTTGLYLESDLKSLIPCKGRAVVYVDLHESTSYEQQVRARNAIRGIMKRLPHSSFIVTYPLVEDYHPWEVLDLFASTGMHTGYGTSQFSDDMAVERDLVEAIGKDQFLNSYKAAGLHATGIKPRPILNTWTPNVVDPDELPDSIAFFKPKAYWSGAGAMVFNVDHGYNDTLSQIGDSLRAATGKPAGMRYGRSGPLFEPNSYEVGTGWGHKQSFQIPGISLPEDYLTMTMDEIQENLDNRLVDECMDKVDYVPMKGGPTNLYDISQEQFRITKHGKRLLEDEGVPPKSRKESDKRTPLGVFNRLVAFARTQDLKDFKHTFRAQWSAHRGKPFKNFTGRPGRLAVENMDGHLSAEAKYRPTAWESENMDLFHDSREAKESMAEHAFKRDPPFVHADEDYGAIERHYNAKEAAAKRAANKM